MRPFQAVTVIVFLGAGIAIPAAGAGKFVPVEIHQRWRILLDRLDREVPCEAAEAKLLLRDERNRKVAELRIPVAAGAGRETAEWALSFPIAGEYRLHATIEGCRKGRSGTATFPVFVHPISKERFVHLQVASGPDAYHLSRLYVNRERIGDDLFELEFDPHRIRNLSDRPLVPCRRSPNGEVEYFGQVGPEWRQKGDFEVAGGFELFEPGEWVPLHRTAVYMFMDFGGLGTVREVVRISYREAGTVPYPEDPGPGEEGEPFPPFCDAYFVEIWGPEPPAETP